MRKFILLFPLLLVYGCALTAPDGVKELMQDIQNDREHKTDERAITGEPEFVRVRAYPRFTGGNIHGAHWILLQVGKKPLDMQALLETTEN